MDRSVRPPGSGDPRIALEPLERSLCAYQEGARGEILRVVMDTGDEEEMPVELFFRAGRRLRVVDRKALALCRGRVLDVGAGAGALALALQAAGHEVTALEILPGLTRVLRARGVRDVKLGDLWTLEDAARYDTVLALMNGTAAAGSLTALPPFLGALAGSLAVAGQLLIDSTDLREEGRPDLRDDGRYVGELQYQLEYQGRRGAPFPQLFVDPDRLGEAAERAGLTTEVVWGGAGGAFLARLTRS